MILLDTDHLTLLEFATQHRGRTLSERLQSTADPHIATTVISFEEQMRGWLAEIRRRIDVEKQVAAYQRLATLVQFFQRWELRAFDLRAAAEFKRLRKIKVRIGTQDLKIASIALTNGALLLSANLRDFVQVPGLRVENWLE